MPYRGLWLESVAKAGVSVDEASVGHRLLELVAQLAHVHIHRAVTGAQIAVPNGPVELLASNECSSSVRKGDKQLELAHRQRQGAPAGEHQALPGPDLELARIKGAGAVWVHGHRP